MSKNSNKFKNKGLFKSSSVSVDSDINSGVRVGVVSKQSSIDPLLQSSQTASTPSNDVFRRALSSLGRVVSSIENSSSLPDSVVENLSKLSGVTPPTDSNPLPPPPTDSNLPPPPIDSNPPPPPPTYSVTSSQLSSLLGKSVESINSSILRLMSKVNIEDSVLVRVLPGTKLVEYSLNLESSLLLCVNLTRALPSESQLLILRDLLRLFKLVP